MKWNSSVNLEKYDFAGTPITSLTSAFQLDQHEWFRKLLYSHFNHGIDFILVYTHWSLARWLYLRATTGVMADINQSKIGRMVGEMGLIMRN